ncbi:LytTr DNA-binding domain protein [compost metagenome]
MKLLTVKMHDRVGDDSDFVEIDLMEDVNYIDLWDKTKHSTKVLAFHTAHGSYLAITTLTDIANVCKKFGFKLVGQSAVINSKKVKSIKSIDRNGSIVKFVDGKHINVRKQI